MIRNCPKCSYTRKATDSAVPDWQCPSCGIAYAKYAEQPQAPVVSRGPVLSAPAAAPMSAKALFFILAGLVAVGYVGYDRFAKAKAPGTAEEGGSGESGQILETSNPAFYGTLEGGQAILRMKPETSADLALIAPGKVVMFATSWCPYCAKARSIFNKQGVRFTEIDVEADPRGAEYQKTTFGSTGVPIIVIGNRVTLGFDEGQILKGLKEI